MMIKPRFNLLACCLVMVCLPESVPEALAAPPTVPADEKRAEAFDREIAPILAQRCLECHAGAAAEAGLDLTGRAAAFKGGESGPAIVPSQVDRSLMWTRIAADEMPPEHPLDAQERTVLREWIQSGAHWGTDPVDRFQYSSESRAGYDWWSLQPLQAGEIPALPEAFPATWSQSPIDRFLAARLHAAGLEPSPPADPRVLVRRLYFDLLGLPPEPEVIEAFAAKPDDAAYRRLVDRLLDSPHYGERWGRHWLDVVRFGESHGFERNAPREHAWHYRDWIIQALNTDMPYDQFARMQLAGDLLKPDREGVSAAGFLVAGVHNTVVGQSERMKRLARQDELEEVIGTIGQTFLGLTVNCSRCHDHKFDPITSREYYQLIAAIDGVGYGDRQVDQPDIAAQRAEAVALRDEIQSSFTAIRDQARERVLEKRRTEGDQQAAPAGPTPFAAWEFEDDFKDQLGSLHGEPIGGARLEDGMLVLDGQNAFVRTPALPKTFAEKTLEAWVMVEGLDQRGGGVVSIQTNDGSVFDAIVYGEREPQRWMAGSNVFARTQSFQGEAESAAGSEAVHVAIVYAADGTIRGYRNGLAYGKPYQTGFVRFEAGQSHVVFGLRHSPAGGNRMLRGRILRAAIYDRALSPEAVAASAGRDSDYVSEEAIVASLESAERARYERLGARLDELNARVKQFDEQARLPVYSVTPGTPGAMRVHIRGSVTSFGDEVAPAGLRAISGVDPAFGLAVDASDRDRRMRLANWITDRQNPLLARVMVNRIWHYHFGTGIVDTPNDLGFNGGRPSHPQLLDWLATRFRDEGFRLKQLHREIVTSAAYRQASRPRPEALAADADNRLLWRFTPRRIEAESLRDAVLQVAGVLNTEMGGPGFRDVSVTYNAGTTYYEPIDPEGAEFYRRTVYRFTPRGGRSAVLDTFDCPDPSSTAPRRSVTTTPLQALSLLNNRFILRMARQFAERVGNDAGDDREARIRRAWNLAVGRNPDEAELKLSAGLVDNHGLSTLCRALINSNEFIVIE